ncbi:polysaccharide pyruvyl transferase family protein [Marinirhabdus gelatinilytica]|uniref:Polysaccharide pyruvyl transferase n=1 Tax=Marinirhabdus gelatinilytica TaxID=1703343 RepID=A0A370Q8X0_9FLAO|nr:polysaccharide pyruvyl transferase family protein [Marinirhabdus gelatinilytica]RDK84808.1 polysaccharide pyruvyl transferase [Marinirhabdus gelatinilytica]
MALRTYYWTQRNVSLYKYYKYKFFKPDRLMFRFGNAGDIFNKDLLTYLYQEKPVNIKNEGNRLLLVGSIATKIKEGDIINGIGWKGNDMKDMEDLLASLKVYGVRGPLTKSLFEKSGTDLSQIKFEYDPGLLIKEVYNLNTTQNTEEQVVFLPHYQDKAVYKGKFPKSLKVIDIDNKPKKIAKEIMKAKVVYSSSLHGIIFSHALDKPCVFVEPQSNEPIFKYRDYYLSVGLEQPEPIANIYAANFIKDKPTKLTKKIGREDFFFPGKKQLKEEGIIL